MKYIISVFFTLLIFVPSIALAQEEASPSGNQVPESDEEIEQVRRIKDIVASRVAELNLVEKRGIVANITEVSSTEIKATNLNGENVDISVDELTNFNFEEEDFGISDLETGTLYSFIGLYNKDTENLLARFISQPASIPQYVEGGIASINDEDFQVDVMDAEGQTTVVDVETSTETMVVGREGNLTDSGFSNLLLGQRVIVVGFETEDETISASRLIHFEDIPPTAEVLAKLQNQSNVATGSGNELEVLENEGVGGE